MNRPNFIRIGGLIINTAAISNISDNGEELFITLLSIEASERSVASGCLPIFESEIIELNGAEAEAVRQYLYSPAFSKNILVASQGVEESAQKVEASGQGAHAHLLFE